ncbi:hypothetical protein GOBAR_AA16239 [Gossypium barbadense]|uniref:Uncharacterized protein n=1 Tax=Gossypium barbadense TaxID=3634 RepID=A0A2P5XM55_GOSBA|nr:hypothetical protein GOBAR_AA16239 [Gossypium barbadense]
MSPLNLSDDFNCYNGGEVQERNFLSLPSIFPHQIGRVAKNSEMGFQIPTSLMEQSNKSLNFDPFQTRGADGFVAAGDGKSGFLGVEKKGLSLNLSVENESNKNPGGSVKNGHTKLCSRGHWRPAEDARLKELVAQYGPQNWNLIAEHLEGRSGKSCRLRWFNQLDPRINRKAFSEEEEERLLTAHKVYGNKWALIARLFPGLDLTVRNNASSDQSTISCSNSTSTDLALTPSSTKKGVPPHQNFTAFSGVHQKGEKVKVGSSGNGDFGKYGSQQRPMGVVMGVDQYANSSDSNSEISATESVGTNRTNHSQTAIGDDKINMHFIDFLGVGAS